jgi:hypothetical protein
MRACIRVEQAKDLCAETEWSGAVSFLPTPRGTWRDGIDRKIDRFKQIIALSF